MMGSATLRQEQGRRGKSHPRQEQVCGVGEGHTKTGISRDCACWGMLNCKDMRLWGNSVGIMLNPFSVLIRSERFC